MSTFQEYRCEVCGLTASSPSHWFVIRCDADEVAVIRWNTAAANAPGARHYCGEAHAQVYVSRWFESLCSPALPDFTKASA